jgi:hypothetical protein
MSVRMDVDRALEIIPQLEKLKAELKDIETRLLIAGYKAGERGEHEDLKDADREGRRWLAVGSDQAVPLIFTADKLLGSFQKDSPQHSTIRTAIGPCISSLPEFFKAQTVYKNRFDDGKKFRARAEAILGTSAAPFITACVAKDKEGIAKSDVRVDWDHAEAVAR